MNFKFVFCSSTESESSNKDPEICSAEHPREMNKCAIFYLENENFAENCVVKFNIACAENLDLGGVPLLIWLATGVIF